MEQETNPKVNAAGATAPKKGLLNDILDIMESVLVSIFVVLVFFAFVMRPVTVDGDSMNPTLNTKDRVLMVELFYQPDNGDIIIADGSDSHTLNADNEVVEGIGCGLRLIKRVIALSGQTVDIDFETGEVTVDGVVLDEPYINALTQRNDGAFTYPLTVPEGYIFVMGDNRMHSMDSRNSAVGLIDKDDVIGRAVARLFVYDAIEDSEHLDFSVLE